MDPFRGRCSIQASGMKFKEVEEEITRHSSSEENKQWKEYKQRLEKLQHKFDYIKLKVGQSQQIYYSSKKNANKLYLRQWKC